MLMLGRVLSTQCIGTATHQLQTRDELESKLYGYSQSVVMTNMETERYLILFMIKTITLMYPKSSLT